MENKPRVHKRPLGGGEDSDYKIYKFKVLLPNGTSVVVSVRNPKSDIGLKEFVGLVRDEYNLVRRHSESMKQKRNINWKSEKLHLMDANERKITSTISLGNFKPHKCHIIWLHDGSGETVNKFENMWDLTPDTDLLTELPEEYTFQTALADLIDNSLQAVWFNGANERRLIRVDILEDKISIFDTGPGMDSSEEKSIAMWGKLGASLHRLSKEQAICSQPPYLKPVFGMFGYGGPMASMHLGRRAFVYSKTKESKKVWCLILEREALLSRAGSGQSWRSTGGIRDPSKDEVEESPHGSFTKVVISNLKQKDVDICKLQGMLKDIYFPYIQCDELSKMRKISTPVEFQVNGVNLAEVEGGEVAITNLHSCNGLGFTLQLQFSAREVSLSNKHKGSNTSKEANAHLKCVYFPIVKGKERIEEILENVKNQSYGNAETFESFSRVSIRRLGRLLPDARWSLLPFMDLRQKKGAKAHLLKKCCMRVKCFIDTDAGFKPTPSKTDLMHQNPFTNALKSLGSRSQEKGGVNVKICRDGNILTHAQLEKEYHEWVSKMHEEYDEEIEVGEDEPVLLVGPKNKKELGVSSDVVRVHKKIKKGHTLWKRNQNIKILKGACPGCHDKNVFATVEYFLIEGFQGDTGGGARIICRPIGLEAEKGCSLQAKDGIMCLDIRKSLSLPISVIDSGKCMAISTAEWEHKLTQLHQNTPSFIDLLDVKQCKELDFEALPAEKVYAGHIAPTEIVAVIRPMNFVSSSASKSLDQKHILKDNLMMSLKLIYSGSGKDKREQHIYSSIKGPSSCKGLHGLYIFQTGKFQDLFQKAGVFTFKFSCENSSCKRCEKKVLVVGARAAASWELFHNEQNPLSTRVGFRIPQLSVVCYDKYHNRIPFQSNQDLKIKLTANGVLLYDGTYRNGRLSSDKLILKIDDFKVETEKLDMIRPDYDAALVICSQDEELYCSVPCQVHPGTLGHVRVHSPLDRNQLLPGLMVKGFKLEMFDAYGNHLAQGSEIEFNVNGFSIQGQLQKVDRNGYIDLGGLLKVTSGYGKSVSLSVLYEGKPVFRREFATVKRELQLASQVPKQCIAGSKLEGVSFKVVDSEGVIDETVHHDENCDQYHTLHINSELLIEDSVRFAFQYGYCTIPVIHLPQRKGLFSFTAQHSRYTELKLMIEVALMYSPKVEPDEFLSPCSDGKLRLLEYFPSTMAQGCLVPFNEEKVLWDDLEKYAHRNGMLESKIESLEKMMVTKELSILELKASLEREPNLSNRLQYMLTKEGIVKEMEGRFDSTAAVLYLPHEVPLKGPEEHLIQDVIGVVALLGTVGCPRLSRVLAEYLGEDQMLAVVCKSFAAAFALEKYDERGHIDGRHGIHAIAEACGRSINGRFHVFCLEDIRPYDGKLEGSGPCRKLALPAPMLNDGSLLPDFLGYAVNMVNPQCESLHCLRETLFYRLLGKLQVYGTRDGLEAARRCNCISDGAVSLDGGIVRGNGLIYLGLGAPKICFPVDMHLSAQSGEILSQFKSQKDEVVLIKCELEKLRKAHETNKKKYNRRKRKVEGTMDAMSLFST